MNLYPAVRFQMGTWTYYVVKMSMRELADNVKFAHEVNKEERTLDDVIQRALNEKRVKDDIITYLQRQPDRFFASIVVAALKGNPKFIPVLISPDDPRFEIIGDDERFNEAFGVLRFDGTQDYYALDGQHRLASIKSLINPNDVASDEAPAGFADDEISVIVVVPRYGEEHADFMRRYRKLFSNLNRYAKPMDKATSIAMDEDDVFAILTRRLLGEHEFFKSAGRERESTRIKTDKGKNLRTGDPYFTSLEALYDVNIILLESRERKNTGWGVGQKAVDYARFRPADEVIEALWGELKLIWDLVLAEVPALSEDPAGMRKHDLTDEEIKSSEEMDHLLFWPIGQELFAEVVRDLLDQSGAELAEPESEEAASSALLGLGRVDWRLHVAPWRYFILKYDEGADRWAMRNEDRREVMRIAERLIRFMIGEELSAGEIEGLKLDWSTRLIPAQMPKDRDKMWDEVLGSRAAIVG